MQTLNDASKSSRSVRNRFIGLAIILCVLVAVGLFLPKAVSLMLFPPSEKGSCSVLSDTECVSLSVQEIERLFFVDLDDDVEVLESHTSHDFTFNRQSALLRIHNGDPHRILTRYSEGFFGELSALPADRASEAGISTLQEILVSPRTPRTATTTAFIGLNTQDEMLVYLLKEW